MMNKEERLFYLLLLILFLLYTIGAFIDFLVCMYVIFDTIRLGIAALFIYLKQLMLLLLEISLFANVELLVTRLYDATTFRFLKSVVLAHVHTWHTWGREAETERNFCVFKAKRIHIDGVL